MLSIQVGNQVTYFTDFYVLTEIFINRWLSFEFLCRMGDVYYDVSEERSASLMVTESGLRGC